MILILLSIILVLLLINWFKLIRDTTRTNIPGPFPLPFLGNAHLFMADTSEFLNLLHKFSLKYGDVFRVHFFSTPCVIISHPKYLEELLTSSELITKGRTYRFLEPCIGKGLVTSTGSHWKMQRKFLTPAFHYNILQDYLPVFCKNFNILMEKLHDIPKGVDIDLYPIVSLASLDVITESIMGVCVDAQKYSESEYVKSLKSVAYIISQRMQIPYLGDNFIFSLLPIKTRHDNALKVMQNHVNKIIEARRQELEKKNINTLKKSNELGIKNRHAFLDLLLLSEIDGKRIDAKDVNEQVNTFMFAGHDTSTSVISWTLYTLSKRRDIQEKIFAELRTIFGDDMDRDPTYQEIQQLKYLDLVIKESMRLYATIPLIERYMEKDCEFSGLKLLKGTTVSINIFQIHRHADLYEDPLEFKPERFELPLKSPFDWLGFSAGPRNCIGQKFAMTSLKVALSTTIKNFIILPSEIQPKVCAELALKSSNGLHVKLLRRN